MTHAETIEILELLMEGIHPVTGEILSKDVLSEPDVILAMRAAIRALRLIDDKQKNSLKDNHTAAQYQTKRNRMNAGRPWTSEDDKRLKELFQGQASTEEMCEILQRRPRGLNNRMVYLGLIQPEPNYAGNPAIPGMERAGMSWSHEEDQILRMMFDQQKPLGEIAQALHRSERSIQFRMERLQLIDNAENYPESSAHNTRKDNEDLKRRYLSGQSIADIAACYHMPEQAIRARLFYLGLSSQSPVSLPILNK